MWGRVSAPIQARTRPALGRTGLRTKEAPLARVIPSLVSSSSRVGTDKRSVLAEGPAAMSEGRARKRRGSGRGGSIMAGDGGGQRDGQ